MNIPILSLKFYSWQETHDYHLIHCKTDPHISFFNLAELRRFRIFEVVISQFVSGLFSIPHILSLSSRILKVMNTSYTGLLFQSMYLITICADHQSWNQEKTASFIVLSAANLRVTLLLSNRRYVEKLVKSNSPIKWSISWKWKFLTSFFVWR